MCPSRIAHRSALHYAPFTLHTVTRPCRPSLRRRAPFTPPPFNLPHFTPPPFTLALHCAAHCPAFRRPSPITPPPFTPALQYAALHSHPSLRSPSPLTTSPSLPPFVLRRSSFPPFIPPHRQLPFVERQLLLLGGNSYHGSSPRRAAVAICDATNPATDRRTATRNHILVEENSYRSRSHSVTYIRHPSSFYPANSAWNSPPPASRRPPTAPPSRPTSVPSHNV
jgi:hypothetical protein